MKTLKTLIVALLGLTSLIMTANGICADVLIDQSPQTYQCNSPGTFTNSSLQQMPVGGKLLAITAELKIDTYCPPANSPYRFAVVTLDHPTIPGNKIRLFDIYWDVINKRLVFSTEDANGVSMAYYLTTDTLPSPSFWYSFTAWTDLSGNVAKAHFGLPGKVTASTTSMSTKSYPSTWTVNMNPTLYLCSDTNGGSSIGCQVANLKTFYQVPTWNIQLKEGSFGTLFAKYDMNQTSGWVINNAVGSLGPAFFGSSTETTEDPVAENKPSWIPKINPATGLNHHSTGVNFTNETQYVTIPTFPIAMGSQSPSYPVTFRFWIRVDAYPANDRYVLRYSKSDLSGDFFGIKLGIGGCLMFQYGSRSMFYTGCRQLNKGYWTSAVVSFNFRPYASDGTKHYATVSMLVNNWEDYSGEVNPDVQLPGIFDPTNVVRLGGFVGSISGLEIYNPGSTLITGSSCSPTTCVRDIGLSNPSTCVLPKCHSTCASCTNSLDTGCLSCYLNHVFYQGKCVPGYCAVGKYLDLADYTCKDCISGCNTCTGPTPAECASCRTGFWKKNGLCECVTGSYLPENATTCASCASKTTNCNECTQNGTCTGCYNGYLLINNQCVQATTCPAGTYKQFTACLNCTTNCSLCNGFGCTTCASGFLLYNYQCYSTCPVGTYKYSATSCSSCSSLKSYCTECTSTACLKCSSGRLAYNGNCVVACPAGTYSDGTSCLACSTNCNQCNSTTCLACKTGFYRYNGQCVSSCPAGTTLNGTECILSCPANCTQCTTTECQTCAANYLLHNGQCVSSCPIGFYSTGTACASCSNVATNCAQCTTNECQGCAPSYLLHNGQCVSSCPAGFYSTGTACASCSSVASNCAQCDSSECFVCDQGYLLYNGECVTACPTGTYSMCAALGF